MGHTFWEAISTVRDGVNKQIEALRHGDMGSALEAEVHLYTDGELYDQLSALGDELVLP